MSELQAKQLLEAAQNFVEAQRALRANETQKGYQVDGSHVTVGEAKPLSPNFAASNQLTPAGSS
jgi:hypothetical protein